MALENTGYKGYSTLLKVTNDGNNSPLDINNNLCSESGLPQATKSNTIGDPDYIAPVYDTVTCPIACQYKYLQQIFIQGSPGNSYVLTYTEKGDVSGMQTWTPEGTPGLDQPHTFSIETCVDPATIGIEPEPTATQMLYDYTFDCCNTGITVTGIYSSTSQCGAGDDTKIIVSSVTLSSPVTVDTIFTVEVVYSINGSCTTSLGSATTDVTILAGETSGDSPECSGGAPGFPSEITAVICSSTVTGHNNTVDNIVI